VRRRKKAHREAVSASPVAGNGQSNGKPQEMSAAARKLYENAALRGATGSNNVTRQRQLEAAKAKR